MLPCYCTPVDRSFWWSVDQSVFKVLSVPRDIFKTRGVSSFLLAADLVSKMIVLIIYDDTVVLTLPLSIKLLLLFLQSIHSPFSLHSSALPFLLFASHFLTVFSKPADLVATKASVNDLLVPPTYTVLSSDSILVVNFFTPCLSRACVSICTKGFG